MTGQKAGEGGGAVPQQQVGMASVHVDSMIGQKAGEGGRAVPQQQVGMAGLHDVPLFHDDHPAKKPISSFSPLKRCSVYVGSKFRFKRSNNFLL
jgi:hypothetical protein